MCKSVMWHASMLARRQGDLYTYTALQQSTLPLRGLACKFAERAASRLLYKLLSGQFWASTLQSVWRWCLGCEYAAALPKYACPR